LRILRNKKQIKIAMRFKKIIVAVCIGFTTWMMQAQNSAQMAGFVELGLGRLRAKDGASHLEIP